MSSAAPLFLLQSLQDAAAAAQPLQLMRSPGLLSPEFQAAALDLVRSLPDAALLQALGWLQATETELRQGRLGWQSALAPLERLLQALDQGVLTWPEVLQRAQHPELALQISPLYLRLLLRQLFDDVETEAPERLWLRMELIHRAVHARPPSPEAAELARAADQDSLKIAQWYLCTWADGRVLREAQARGEALLQDPALPPEERGDVLHAIGTLFLDPYTAAYRPQGYRTELQQWMRRFAQAQAQLLARLEPAQWQMPAPLEALRQAEHYLRQACRVRSGHEKGLSCKALAQTLQWWHFAAGVETESGEPEADTPNRSGEVAALAREAIALLDPRRDPQQLASARAMLAVHEDAAPDAAQAQAGSGALPPGSPDQHVQQWGVQATHDLYLQTATTLRHSDLREALRLVGLAQLVDRVHAHETGLRAALDLHVRLLHHLGGLVHEELGSLLALQQHSARIQTGLNEGSLDPEIAAAQLLTLADACARYDAEDIGLRLLEELARLAPLFARQHEAALRHQQAILQMGCGVNAFQAEDLAQALLAYAQALQIRLDMGMPQYALHMADRMADCVERADHSVVDALCQALDQVARPLLQQAGAAGQALLLRMGVKAQRGLQPSESLQLFRLLHFAKGFEFSAALMSSAAARATLSREEQAQLARLAQAEQALGSTPAAAPLDDTLLREYQVVAFLSPDELGPARSAAERLTHLRRAYDQLLTRRLLDATPAQQLTLLSLRQVQNALDPGTLLADFFLGEDGEGRVAVQLLLLTREQVGAVRVSHNFPSGRVEMEADGQCLHLDPLATLVAALREQVQAPSGPQEAIDEASQALEHMLPALFGNSQTLERYRAAGKTHLCIVPHGGLHYLPFHLIRSQGQPLAQQWAVSVLPHLHLLLGQRGQPAPRPHKPQTLVAVGMSYREPALNPFKLAVLDDGLAEAEEVAAVFQAPVLREAQATQAAVQAALSDARYVHLSLHGQQDALAPAFHCLHAAPDADSDGRIFAHEVLGWDLQAVDLLTLSACETGLGRFDQADNLRGLPASFFLAGVSSLVGSLWPVNAAASRCFFVHLYQGLHGGRSRLQAFWAAQQATRAAFPRYADWGAFYLAGEWR